MLSALSAALLFCACSDGIVEGTVIPLGINESYSVNDTAIVYNMANDTARIVVTYRLVDDTVRQTTVEHTFDNSEQATDFFNTLLTDIDIRSIRHESRMVSYDIENCNGLSTKNVVDILKGEYLYDEVSTDTLENKDREFTIRSFNGLQEGMYFMLSHNDNGSRLYFHSSTLRGDRTTSSFVNDPTQLPWQLLKAPAGEGWLIRLSNGCYLRRSGNRVVPMALTVTSSADLATAWNVDDVVNGLNFWTIHDAIGNSDDFCGLTPNDNETLGMEENAIETFTLLVDHVKMTFNVAGTTWSTLASLWGCSVPLPSYTDTLEGSTFIGWNTKENTVEGYLTPGTLVTADDTTYYAVLVKTN